MSSAGPIIHLVDDDVSIRTSLTRLLGAMGFTVKTYASAEEFRGRTPGPCGGCLILDLSMPGMNGLELQDALAGDADPLPILFLTGRGDVRSCALAMKAGAVDFLTKPVQRDELAAAIHRALAKDAEAREARARISALASWTAQLTPRERDVFQLVTQGKLNKQIAAILGTTVRTVKAHRAKVMRKLGADSLADLVKIAERLRSAGPDAGSR